MPPTKSPPKAANPIKSSNSPSSSVPAADSWGLQSLPFELQVRTLSYLRAVDLSAVHQVNRYFWEATNLQHAIVVYCAAQVYPPKWTEGFQHQPISSAATTSKGVVKTKGKAKVGGRSKSRSSSFGSVDDSTSDASESSPGAASPELYTFEHLRNMELLVVARVLNSPEPMTGYVVSKSWCKTALCWLEGQQERLYQQQQDVAGSGKKKKGKKIKKQRKTSGSVAPPPANVNSDITCAHDQLQHYTSSKSARARRRLLDKQAWKILKVLYPESTPLPAATGECLQCRAEACQQQKLVTDQQEVAKEQRKRPLKDPAIRRFYTRTRGVPELCLREKQQAKTLEQGTTVIDSCEDMDRKMPALPSTPIKLSYADIECQSLFTSSCPLVDGTYYVLPRAWCHGWRRFMKTGEGGMSSSTYAAPDAACLLCDAHRLALLPPHLEAFLYGESVQLLEGSGLKHQHLSSPAAGAPGGTSWSNAPLPPGQGPTQESIQAMRLLGLSESEISRQLSAMRSIEAQQQRLQREAFVNNAAAEESSSVSRNEMLDRENHSVVEILTQAEFRALTACWPGTTVFALRFTVQTGKEIALAAATGDSLICGGVNFCTPVCRSCDATGRRCSVSIKNRARGWVKKSADNARAPASLEY
jgi:hypothetical protein